MKFNQKTIHAITLLTKLNIHQRISLNDLSKDMGVSKVYLEQVVKPLKNTDFITATLGPKGGYQLLLSPSDIPLFEIIQLFEPTLFENTHLEDIVTHQAISKTMIEPIDNLLYTFFQFVSIQDILNNTQTDPLMFYI